MTTRRRRSLSETPARPQSSFHSIYLRHKDEESKAARDDLEEEDEEIYERDPEPEPHRNNASGWGPLLAGCAALVGLAWYVGYKKAEAAPGQTPPQLPPASPPSPPGGTTSSTSSTSATADVWTDALQKEAERAWVKKKLDPSYTPPQPSQGPTPVNYLSDPIALETGARYRARLRLSGMETMASAGMIAAKFEELGFTGVRVYMTASELPSDWPQETIAGATPNNRFLEGGWGQASLAMPKPDQIEKAWRA